MQRSSGPLPAKNARSATRAGLVESYARMASGAQRPSNHGHGHGAAVPPPIRATAVAFSAQIGPLDRFAPVGSPRSPRKGGGAGLGVWRGLSPNRGPTPSPLWGGLGRGSYAVRRDAWGSGMPLSQRSAWGIPPPLTPPLKGEGDDGARPCHNRRLAGRVAAAGWVATTTVRPAPTGTAAHPGRGAMGRRRGGNTLLRRAAPV
jgi:hypothetical protein